MFFDPDESLQEGIDELKKLKCFREVVVKYSSEKSMPDTHLYALQALDVLMEELTAHLDEDMQDLLERERERNKLDL